MNVFTVKSPKISTLSSLYYTFVWKLTQLPPVHLIKSRQSACETKSPLASKWTQQQIYTLFFHLAVVINPQMFLMLDVYQPSLCVQDKTVWHPIILYAFFLSWQLLHTGLPFCMFIFLSLCDCVSVNVREHTQVVWKPGSDYNTSAW